MFLLRSVIISESLMSSRLFCVVPLEETSKERIPKGSKLQVEVAAQDYSSSLVRLCLQSMLGHTFKPLIVNT